MEDTRSRKMSFNQSDMLSPKLLMNAIHWFALVVVWISTTPAGLAVGVVWFCLHSWLRHSCGKIIPPRPQDQQAWLKSIQPTRAHQCIVHTFFPRVKTIQNSALALGVDCFNSWEEGMDFPMWNGKGDGNGIPVMCTNRRKIDVWEIFIFLQKYNIEQCNMFAKSITLINVILLEAAFWQEKIQIILQKYYIGQCYTFGKHSHWPM